MTDDRILTTLRMQAWARAKAELQAVLETYYSEYRSEKTPDNPLGRTPNGWEDLAPLFEKFIEQADGWIA